MAADEFEIIRSLFAPLADHRFARGLIDDVAVIEQLGPLVVTTDAIVEGVHFLADDPLDTVARKALRVNFSDLIAKGAKPVGVTLALMWPGGRDANGIADFARGLGEDLKRYDVALLGGDTTSTPGPLSIVVTALGVPLGGRTPSRADAEVGEEVWVTGAIGDGFLGLLSLTYTPSVYRAGPADQSDAHAMHIRAAYRTPSPPFAFAETIARHARASMDISDGLLVDAAKLAAASNVALRIDAESVPLSSAGHAYLEANGDDGLLRLLNGGDDYQALFTAPRSARAAILEAGERTETNVVVIGDVLEGSGLRLVGAGGKELPIPAGGHVHKLGR